MSDFALRFLLANLVAAIASLLVIVLRKPARNIFGARLAYSLWLLVPLAALGSLLPPRIVEIARPAPAMTASYPPPSFAPDSFPATPVITPAETSTLAPAPSPDSWTPEPWTPDPWMLGVIAWLAGALAMAIWQLRGQQRFLADARAGFAGPAVAGVFNPRIITPADFEDRFEKSEREVILAHEKIHLDNNDARINALVALMRCLCWFNPLVHIAAHLMRVDQELACDATVVERHPRAKAVYANALLKAQLASRPLPLGCYWPAGTEHPLTERVEMLKQARPTRLRQRIGIAALALLTIGAGATAWAVLPPEERVLFEAPATQAPAAIAAVPVEPAPAAPADEPAPPPAQQMPAASQPVRYEPQQMQPGVPAPSPFRLIRPERPRVVLEAGTSIMLRGKVEKIEFGDMRYVVFLRATAPFPIYTDANGRVLSLDTLWELSPTTFFGDRDAMSADLMGKTIEVRGRNINPACVPTCRIKTTEVAVPKSTEVPSPVDGAPLIATFAQWYDTTAPQGVRGTVERIRFIDGRLFDAYVRSPATDVQRERVFQVRSEYRFPRADIERALLNKTVMATGWRARETISTYCDPVCGMYATSFELLNKARVSPAGETLVSDPSRPAVLDMRLVSEPMPDAPDAFRDLFDWNTPVTIEGKITKIESSGVRASGPGDRNLADIIWVETTSVSPASTPGANVGTVWRVVGGGLAPPLESFIGGKITAFGYVAKDQSCQPTCSMAHVEMSISN